MLLSEPLAFKRPLSTFSKLPGKTMMFGTKVPIRKEKKMATVHSKFR